MNGPMVHTATNQRRQAWASVTRDLYKCRTPGDLKYGPDFSNTSTDFCMCCKGTDPFHLQAEFTI